MSATINLKSGDVLPALGGRTVASVERNFDNLDATLIRFTDGSFFHAGTFDPWVTARA